MVRKPAPQPLTLAGSALPASDRRLPETLKIASSDDRLAAKRTPTSPASLKLQAAQAVHSAQSAQSLPPSSHESLPQSPAPSQSQPLPLPQSQPHQSQSQRYQKPLHVADLVQQPLDDLDSPGFPPYRQQQSQQQDEQKQQQSQQNPKQQEQPSQQQQLQRQPTQNSSRPPVSYQQKHGHGRRQAEEKSSKSNFRFHFGKSSTSKASEKQAPSTAPNQGQGQSGNSVLSKSSTHSSTGPPGSRAGRSDSQNEEAYPVPPRTAGGSGDKQPPPRSDTSFTGDTDSVSVKKGKAKTFPRIGRSRSIRDEPDPLSSNLNSLNHSATTTPTNIPGSASSPGLDMKIRVAEPDRVHQATHTQQNHKNQQQQPAAQKTAPLAQHDRIFRDKMSSSSRNQSVDGGVTRENRSERDHHHFRGNRSNQDNNTNNGTGGGFFFNGFKNSSRSAADIFSKGWFGKNGRGGGSGGTGSERSSEPVVDDEHYVLKVINQPLVEQTRLTRISKRLEDSRDRTEFWMPAFPWRAIDYLNYKGTDVEGLYRVPGSGPQIKKWQRRFDEEYDVNLFEQEDLYDINIIGSMLKAWLRELPDELFPKVAQERIARECAGAEKVPQMLIDELSNLSPFNYYLLFAITCHLSLLLAHADKNKMDFRNLCICFQPCMKIDAFSFKFLVCDWRECWKGCLNETQYMREEYALFSAPLPLGMDDAEDEDDQEGTRQEAGDVTTPDDGVSSTDSRSEKRSDQRSEARSEARSDARSDRPATRHDRQARAPRTEPSDEALSTTLTSLTLDSGMRVTTPPRRAQSGDMRPLSPIKPLSPMGF